MSINSRSQPTRKQTLSLSLRINIIKTILLSLKLQYLGHLMWRTDSSEKTLRLGKIEGRRRRGQQRMIVWHQWLNGHELEQALGVGDGQEDWRAAIHGVTKSWTWLSDCTDWCLYRSENWTVNCGRWTHMMPLWDVLHKRVSLGISALMDFQTSTIKVWKIWLYSLLLTTFYG